MDGLAWDIKQEQILDPVPGRISSNQCGQQRWEMRENSLRLLLAALVFSCLCSDAQIMGEWAGGSEAAATSGDGLDSSPDSLPEHFYSGKSQKNSYCYAAYSKMPTLCAMASAHDRGLLATLIANCHLETMNQKAIRWDPIDRLKYATREQYIFVIHHLMRLPKICSKAGNRHELAHFQMQFQKDKEIYESLDELRTLSRRAVEVNIGLEQGTNFYREQSGKVLEKASEVLLLLEDVVNSTLSIRSQQKQLGKLQDKIESRIKDYFGLKLGAQRMLKDYAEKKRIQVDRISERLRSQMDYCELLIRFTDLQSQLREAKRKRARCCRQHDNVISKLFRARRKLLALSISWNSSWVGAFKSFLWSSLSAPFRISRLLNFLGESELLGPGARAIVFATQASVILVSVWAMFKILLVAKALVDNVDAARKLAPSMLNMVAVPQPSPSSKESNKAGERNELAISLSREGGKQNDTMMRKLTSRLERRLKSCLKRTLEEMNIENRLSAILVESGRAYEQKLLSRITRIEMRQKHLLNELQAAD